MLTCGDPSRRSRKNVQLQSDREKQFHRYNKDLIRDLGKGCWQVAGYTIWRFDSLSEEDGRFAVNHRKPNTFYAVGSFEEALKLIERTYLNVLYAVEMIEDGNFDARKKRANVRK